MQPFFTLWKFLEGREGGAMWINGLKQIKIITW